MSRTASAKRLTKNDVQIGKPLPWSVVDSQGTLLLKAGIIVNSERQLNRLLHQDVYIGTSNPKQMGTRAANTPVTAKRDARPKGISPFDWVRDHEDALYNAHSAIDNGTGDGVQLIKSVAVDIQKAANRSASA